MSAIGKIGDRLLSVLVPTGGAAAACPPDCTLFRETSAGYCRARNCCYREAACIYRCEPWRAC